jgi:Flp pilus assembly protein TadD
VNSRRLRIWATILVIAASVWVDARAATADTAARLNARGETAYHANNYTLAISLFQAAIAQDEEFAKAYENLSLVYRRTGHIAEAVRVERKAMALAGAEAESEESST